MEQGGLGRNVNFPRKKINERLGMGRVGVGVEPSFANWLARGSACQEEGGRIRNPRHAARAAVMEPRCYTPREKGHSGDWLLPLQELEKSQAQALSGSRSGAWPGLGSLRIFCSWRGSHPAVVHTVRPAAKEVVDAGEGEHGEGTHQGAHLDDGAAPDQGGVARLVQQAADHHLQVGEEAHEQDPRDHLPGEDRLSC